jgi:hypothetical protein
MKFRRRLIGGPQPKTGSLGNVGVPLASLFRSSGVGGHSVDAVISEAQELGSNFLRVVPLVNYP